jgi:CubicO group peptidase (beta-lactamase class C family)
MKSLWKNFWALPRDGARLGLLFARNGMWNSEQLVQPQLIASAVSSSTPFNLAYGYLWWLNGKASGLRPGGKAYSGPFLPNCPSDAYAAVGANGQYVAVIPSLSIVLVRPPLRPLVFLPPLPPKCLSQLLQVRNGCPGSNADDSSNEADDALTPQGVLEVTSLLRYLLLLLLQLFAGALQASVGCQVVAVFGDSQGARPNKRSIAIT